MLIDRIPLTMTGRYVLVGLFLALSFAVLAYRGEATSEPFPERKELAPVGLGPVETVYDRAALRLWSLESSCGRDESWRTTLPERGEFQTTPIWEEDFRDIFGREPRWEDPDAMLREDVPDWLWYRAHSYRLPTPHTVDRLVRLYQEGR